MLSNVRLFLLCSAITGLLLLAVSCNDSRYELKEDKQGNIVRLDKRTGEMAIISGGKLVSLKTPDQQAAEQKAAEDLKTDKTWTPIVVKSLDVNFNLATSWREGRLYYQFFFFPISERIRRAESSTWNRNDRFTVELMDENGFSLLTFDVPLLEMTRIENDNGKPAMEWCNGSISCSESSYRGVTDWTVHWTL